MTAEIALLNKEAVALAADSAVTIRTPGGTKILPSANKIFALSKYHPVGVMVYGNAQLLGVPWELVIKTYRKQLGNKTFPRLEDYADDLIRYIERSRSLFPLEAQQKHFREVASSVLNSVRQAIETALAVFLQENETVTTEEVLAIAAREIESFHEGCSVLTLQQNLSEEFIAQVCGLWRDDLFEGIETILQDYVQDDGLRDKLLEIAVSWLCKAVANLNEGDSGLVVAGYGEEDFFPSLRSFKIEGIVADRLIYLPYISHDVAERGASIVPFAQVDVVHTFMEGVDLKYQAQVEEAVENSLNAFVEAAIEGSGKDNEELDEFQGKLKALAEGVVDRFKASARKYRVENFADPTVSVVDILPKDRLAAMAESLVDITALRRQFSLAEETVGGPIDVAVISKGDGFIWIKRKHYFDKMLNPQFFHNYFQEE